MDESAKEVNMTGIVLPRKSNEVGDNFRVKYFEIVRLGEQFHKRYLVRLGFVIRNARKQIQSVGDSIHFQVVSVHLLLNLDLLGICFNCSGLYIIPAGYRTGLSTHVLRLFLWSQLIYQVSEYIFVLVPEHEHRTIEWTQHSFTVGVDIRPVLHFELVAEYIRLHQVLNVDALLQQTEKVFSKEEVERKGVLVRGDIVDDKLSCHYLVVIECNVNGCDKGGMAKYLFA